MKIEKFEKDKIKVTLTAADLVLYDIEADSVHPDSPKLHKFLFDVMESVKEETGFNPYSGQVVVEAHRDDSGISLIISKIKINTVKEKINPEKVKSVTAKKKVKKIRYIFKSFDDLCDALKMIKNEAVSDAALYQYDNKWHLVNSFYDKRADYLLREFCFEAREISGGNVFLNEHAKLICSGDEFIKMVDGIKALD